MKRKLRKSLSWLLTVAMVFSLFCGMIPTASAVEIADSQYISVDDYNDGTDLTVNTQMTIKVMAPDGNLLEEIGPFRALRPDASMTVSIKDEYIGTYEFDTCEISKSDIGTGSIDYWNDVNDTPTEQTFMYRTYTSETTITITLKEAEYTKDLVKDDLNLGFISYMPGMQNTNVVVYLNNEEFCRFDNLMIQEDRANNFVLNLNDGYYYGVSNAIRTNYDYTSTQSGQTLSYTGTMLSYGLKTDSVIFKDKVDTLYLYIYTFDENDGINVNFDRRGILPGEFDGACPELNISYNLNGETYSFTWKKWEAHYNLFLPKSTNIKVSPVMNDGYSVDYWYTADALGDHANSLYTVLDDGSLLEVTGPANTEGHYALSKDMVFSYGSGYDTALIELHLTETDERYEVRYLSNGGTGTMTSDYFHNGYVIIRENGFTAPDGKTFDGWNTENDGKGTSYAPGTIYGYNNGEKHNLTLYAQWKDSGTTPGEDYAITDFDKELVTTEAEATAAGATGITFPGDDGKVTVPVNDEVTLLYKLTVTGKVGAQFTITEDENVDLVNTGEDYALADTDTGTTITGTIPEGGTATIYVTKTFVVGDIEGDKLTNSATITTTANGGVAPGEGEAEAETGAEEGAPVPPTDDELENLLGENAVLIHCTTAEFDHPEMPFALIEGSYNFGEVTGTAENASVAMTVSSEMYVAAYETANGGKDHWLNVGETDPETISFTWTKEDGWQVASASAIPVVFTVTCEGDARFEVLYLPVEGSYFAAADIGRVADDGVEGPREVLRLYLPLPRVHPFCEGAGRHVLGGLPAGFPVHFHARDAGLWEALRHHQGDEPRAGAHVEYPLPAPGPGSQQHAVRAHFHGAAVVAHRESLELEFPFSHFLLVVVASAYHNAAEADILCPLAWGDAARCVSTEGSAWFALRVSACEGGCRPRFADGIPPCVSRGVRGLLLAAGVVVGWGDGLVLAVVAAAWLAGLVVIVVRVAAGAALAGGGVGGFRLLADDLALVVGYLGVHVVDEVGVLRLPLDEGEGVDPLHEGAVGLVRRLARVFQRAHGLGHALLGAVGGEGAHALVGLLQGGDEGGEREGAHLLGVLALQVGQEVDEHARLLVQLLLRVDGVVDDVLVERFRGLRQVFHGQVEEALHGLLVADVELVAVVVGLGDVVGQQALLRELQVSVLLGHGGLEGAHLGGRLLAYFRVGLGAGQHVAYIQEVRAVVQAPYGDSSDFFHIFIALWFILGGNVRFPPLSYANIRKIFFPRMGVSGKIPKKRAYLVPKLRWEEIYARISFQNFAGKKFTRVSRSKTSLGRNLRAYLVPNPRWEEIYARISFQNFAGKKFTRVSCPKTSLGRNLRAYLVPNPRWERIYARISPLPNGGGGDFRKNGRLCPLMDTSGLRLLP